MGMCELCGNNEAEVTATVEGSDLKVCNSCSKFGKVKKKTVQSVISKTKNKAAVQKEAQQEIEELVDGYGNIIKKAREKLGLRQDSLAKILSEKESLVNNIEREHLKPSINTVKKIEKALNIKLIEKIKEEKEEKTADSSKNLTIGDVIKIKIKKKI